MNDQQIYILKEKLIHSQDNLVNIIGDLSDELKEYTVTDSSGQDPQNLEQISTSLKNKLSQFYKDLDSPFKIAVVGSQGTGKSTIVNLLLGQALMPSTTSENENVIVRLCNPKECDQINKAVFEFIDGSTKVLSIDEANKIIDKASRGTNELISIKDIKYATFYIESEVLNNIELINTPGMNVLTDDFYPKVQHLFAEADVILWVNSKEQILDQFNSWLIKKIHADNDRIVGIITFPDKLYRQDEDNGVIDVVNQFLINLEGNRLMRVNDEIALFIFNGIFAQISKNHKGNSKFIIDLEDFESEESKLRMIYNYMHHGFAYSDSVDNLDVLIDNKLYGIKNSEKDVVNFDFDVETFYNYCLEKGLCTVDSNSAYYTDLGLEVLGEVSQYNAFARFSEEHLIPRAKNSKVEEIKRKLKRIASKEESDDNVISRLNNLKIYYENEIEKLGREDLKRKEDYKKLVKFIKSRFDEWVKINLPHESNSFEDKVLTEIFKRIEKEIGVIEFMKEVLNSLIPNFLKGENSESPISRKVSLIIEDIINKETVESLNEIAKRGSEHIEIIFLDLERENINNKFKKDDSYSTFSFEGKDISNIDVKPIMNKILKIISPLMKKILQNLLKDIAKRDLRKGANTVFKRNFIKPVVKLIRKLIQKEGKKIAIKKAKSTAAKGGIGPLGWALIVYDLMSLGKDFYDMYYDIKRELKKSLKLDGGFDKLFYNQAEIVLEELIESINKELLEQSSSEDKNLRILLSGISICEKIENDLKKYTL